MSTVSGSTRFLIARLEVWSGKHTINHRVSTCISSYANGKHYALNLSHPLPTLQLTHALERLPVTIATLAPHIIPVSATVKMNCPVFGQSIIIEWEIYFSCIPCRYEKAATTACVPCTVLISDGKRITIN